MYQKRKVIEKVIILLLDLICVGISLVIACQLRFGLFWGVNESKDQIWQYLILAAIAVILKLLFDFDRHFFRRGYFEELISVGKEQIVISIFWIIALYLLHKAGELSRLVFGYFTVVNIVLTYTVHLLLKQFLTKGYKQSKYSSRMLLVTTRGKVNKVLENIVSYNEWNRILNGLVLLDEKASGQIIDGIPVVADGDSFLEYVIHHDIDEVFMMDEDRRHMDITKPWIKELAEMGIVVDVNIDTFDIDIHGQKMLNRVGKYAVVTFARNVFSTRQVVAKRVLDVVGSLVGMVLLGIATIFVAPAIKLESPGPVFFGQTRIGKNGRRFTFYKFRSMYQDAEKRKKELMEKNEVQGLMFKMTDDPRITKVGKFIRKTSIDELPQFWNVLKGDMSLVGTRPPTVDEFEQYEAKHKCRLSMTPGLTGLWQISGRSDIKDFDEVVELDMQYIDNWTISKDIKIIIKTVWVVLTGHGSR